MRLRPYLLAALIVSAAALPGCANSKKNAKATAYPQVEVPAKIADLDEFADYRNDFALLAVDHPQREAMRGRLIDFLVSYLDAKIRSERDNEATTALEFLVDLYTPAELRQDTQRVPAIASAAHSVYLAAARRGNESPAMLALAAEQHFGADSVRERALSQWRDLEEWILRNGVFSDEAILRHEELEETLEETAALFPSPFIVQRLSDLYLARYEAALAAIDRGSEIGLAARQRAEVTGYLLIRLHLRADDFEGTLASLEKINPDIATRKMMEFIREAQKSERSANAILTLAAQFIPETPDEYSRIPPSFFVQGWGIVENLARRALLRYPDDPFAHLLLARALRQDGLVDASIHHYERSIDLKEDIRDAWEELAFLEQMSLERLAETDPAAAEARLGELDVMHKRAAELWPDRPIRPGLPEANVVVAHGLYNSGRIAPAKALLERSLKIEPVPEALYLLGTIELKQGKLSSAADRFREMVALPFDNQLQRLRWETKAHGFLAQIAASEGKSGEAAEHRRIALRQLNSLISFPSLDEDERSAFLVDRGKIFLASGDAELAMDDFRQARLATPDRTAAYTEPMLYAVSRGYYDEALEIFHHVLTRDEIRETLKLYFSLWLTDLALRQGHEADAEVAALLRDFKADAWPHKLALHAQGKLSFDELLKGAADEGERAEAYFYEGLRQWRSGDPKGAKSLMKKVLGTGMMSFYEYDMALHYLERGELPTTRPKIQVGARKPAPTDSKR
ncbi:MAG: tetratricopeptide repeat protein [Myxococcales bacterium]|nr:tetratricopeptide repeat protein [Myxococcales bacterium]